ncbi:hypothetical protein [Paenibacillus odorifer]|uniref:hypothetical protein n=1 Tax=Paenibacillus odorifer TaxID=189426 RepID=UPI00096BE99F|nr:hypothetical protein [Paenibacillus odorifer]OMD67603.1 hypothetical protein BSK50_29990 [Paenibacillus odorifer]
MDYKFRLLVTLAIRGEVDNQEYMIEEGTEVFVQSQSIDKTKWFVYIPSIEKYDYIEKYHFGMLIHDSITASYYGEFQLPVISKNIHTYTFLTPSGYVQWISKSDAGALKSYSKAQLINSDEIRFR